MLPYVPAFIPPILQVLPIAVACCLLFSRQIRSYPGAFYAAFAVLTLVRTLPDVIAGLSVCPESLRALAGSIGSATSSSGSLGLLFDLACSSYTGVALYLIVMFVGALERTPAVKRLLSIRSELSVIAGIVVAGHVVRIAWMPLMYATPGFAQAWGASAAPWMFVAIALVGPLLTVCFLVPWVTSFRFVRRRMGHRAWKRTQLLAYPFMALMVLQGLFLSVGHLFSSVPQSAAEIPYALIMDPAGWLSSFAGGVVNATFYALAGIAYLTLRLQRRSSAKAKAASATLASRGDGDVRADVHRTV